MCHSEFKGICGRIRKRHPVSLQQRRIRTGPRTRGKIQKDFSEVLVFELLRRSQSGNSHGLLPIRRNCKDVLTHFAGSHTVPKSSLMTSPFSLFSRIFLASLLSQSAALPNISRSGSESINSPSLISPANIHSDPNLGSILEAIR